VADVQGDDEAAFAAEIQQRLLAEDPVASEVFCVHYLPLLTRRLQAKYRTTDEDLVQQAVTEALLDHIERPARFDPTRRSLRGYLLMAAERDLQNLRAHWQHRVEQERLLDPVEFDAATRKRTIEAGDQVGATVAERDAADRRAARIMDAAQTEEERRVLRLMMDDEKATEVFAAALGIGHLPPRKQRDRVYAIKDRLIKRARRQRRDDDD